MTIKEILKEGIRRLQVRIESAWLESNVLLCHVLKKERMYLTAHDDEIVNPDKIREFFSCIERRVQGVPLQYITGRQEFMSLDFGVNPSVLVPRQDTEILVEQVLKFISNTAFQRSIYVVDMGTGSGCIAISIAKSINNAYVTAVDTSKDALDIAAANARNLGVMDRIEFIQSNLFEKLGGRKFDIIVSNPPYIPSKVIETLQVEVRDYEPALALDGGEDGLDYYRRIVGCAAGFLNQRGLIAFEIGCEQAETVRKIMKNTGQFSDIRIIKDLAGKDRVATAEYI